MLLSSSVPRALDTKNKLFGFELSDLLLVFLYLSVSNLIFGTTKLKWIVVWGGTLVLGLALHFLKRNKPDNHLQHWGEFQRSPAVFSSARPDLEYRPYIEETVITPIGGIEK
jgi:hypothetical protein